MRRVVLFMVVSLFAVLLPSMAAQAHVERPSYWPDPKPDCTISPCAGGEVPTARSLASALDDAPPGETLVVCQDDSMDRVNAGDRHAAKANGYFIRPTDHQDLLRRRGHRAAADQHGSCSLAASTTRSRPP